MAYTLYLDGVAFPITPSKISTDMKGRNKTIDLINDVEVNILKSPGLTEYKFDLVIPYVKYPYAVYPNKFKPAEYYLEHLNRLMNEKKHFRFICSRVSPSGELLFDTNELVSLEKLSILEEASNGQEVVASIVLKLYKDYHTKRFDISSITNNVVSGRAVKNRPAKTTAVKKTYMVQKGDTLWVIAKKLLDDGTKHVEIYMINQDKIDSPNQCEAGTTLDIPS